MLISPYPGYERINRADPASLVRALPVFRSQAMDDDARVVSLPGSRRPANSSSSPSKPSRTHALEAEIDALLKDRDSIKSGCQQANQLQPILSVILENRHNIVLE